MARRSGLGRGLDAILPSDAAPPEGAPPAESAPGTPNGERLVQSVAVDEIQPNPYQPRRVFDDAALEELAASIRAVGLLQPVLVRPVDGGYQLVAGERRWRAAQRAGLERVPVVVRETDDQAALAQAVVENVQRADLNPIEEAAAYQQLIQEFQLTQEEVATRVGRSRPTVANTLRLLQLAPDLQRRVLEGELTAGHGRALLGTADEDAREALAAKAVADELSVRQLEELVRRHEAPAPTDGPPAAPGSTKPASLLELEQLLADRLSTRVRLELNRKKGRIEIEFADLEDLERIFLLIS